MCPAGFRPEGKLCVVETCPPARPFRELNGTCAPTCESLAFEEVASSASVGVQYACVAQCKAYHTRLAPLGTEMTKCAPKTRCEAPTSLLVASSGACVARCPGTKLLLREAGICLDSCPYLHYYEDVVLGPVCSQACEFPYSEDGGMVRNQTRCMPKCPEYS